MRCDDVERGREPDVGGADTVHVLRSEVALGVDERAPLVLDATGGIGEDDGDLGDAVVLAGRGPCGLEVDHGESGHGGQRARFWLRGEVPA